MLGATQKAPREAGFYINLRCVKLEELLTHIEVVVSQQGIRSDRIMAGRKVVLVCIGKRRVRVEDILNSKQHGEVLDRLDAQAAIPIE
jgi:hypothetical protein